ncbi:hypothetical protein J3R83DRAFT_12446 [Lanmaoa asiatica]|nr:hypothetical protein J3R83DRAFT_12446 [Lanmaoa asiatica]
MFANSASQRRPSVPQVPANNVLPENQPLAQQNVNLYHHVQQNTQQQLPSFGHGDPLNDLFLSKTPAGLNHCLFGSQNPIEGIDSKFSSSGGKNHLGFTGSIPAQGHGGYSMLFHDMPSQGFAAGGQGRMSHAPSIGPVGVTPGGPGREDYQQIYSVSHRQNRQNPCPNNFLSQQRQLAATHSPDMFNFGSVGGSPSISPTDLSTPSLNQIIAKLHSMVEKFKEQEKVNEDLKKENDELTSCVQMIKDTLQLIQMTQKKMKKKEGSNEHPALKVMCRILDE